VEISQASNTGSHREIECKCSEQRSREGFSKSAPGDYASFLHHECGEIANRDFRPRSPVETNFSENVGLFVASSHNSTVDDCLSSSIVQADSDRTHLLTPLLSKTSTATASVVIQDEHTP
jgi:hypothetical protein